MKNFFKNRAVISVFSFLIGAGSAALTIQHPEAAPVINKTSGYLIDVINQEKPKVELKEVVSEGVQAYAEIKLSEKIAREQEKLRAGNEPKHTDADSTDKQPDSNSDFSGFRITGSEEIADKLLGAYGLNHSNMLLITENFRITNFNSSGAKVDLTADQVRIQGEDHYLKRALIFIFQTGR